MGLTVLGGLLIVAVGVIALMSPSRPIDVAQRATLTALKEGVIANQATATAMARQAADQRAAAASLARTVVAVRATGTALAQITPSISLLETSDTAQRATATALAQAIVIAQATGTALAQITPSISLPETSKATESPKSAEVPAIATRVREKDGAVMVNVPAGEFTMGSPDNEGESDEHPQHTVYLDAFWIDRTEVTNAQYRRCLDVDACTQPYYWGNSDLNQDNQPVVGVDWWQAKAYCKWAGARLPTEAEWEKAARGTDRRTYPWGDQDATCRYAVMNSGSGNGCGQGNKAWPVGSKPEGVSPYGALDMAGNVWEWVADWYVGDYYSHSPERNPQWPGSGNVRGRRGGSWYSDRGTVRTASRSGGDPGDGGDNIGFRCAASKSSL